MRETYTDVTPETKRALEDHVKQIADKMDKSPQYLYAILAGESSDPFSKFLSMFRAVARINPDGARGYLAKLSNVLRDEQPGGRETADLYEVNVELGNVAALMRAREEGHCAPEVLEAAKQRLREKVGALGLDERILRAEMQV